MHSTLNPNQTDPRDVFVDAPDVAPHADHAFSGTAPDAMRLHSDPQAHMAYESSAGPSVPPVDTTFRATDVNRARVPGGRRPMGVPMIRGVIGFLLAVCVGVAGALWQSHGDVAREMIAKWVPQLVPSSSPPPESPALADQSNPPAAVQASTETAAPAQPASPAQTTSDAVAPAAAASSPDPAQLQSMAHDLAVAEQEIETLKATVAQLKANQEQISRDVAKVSVSDKPFEPNPRPRISAPLPRPASAPARKPIPQVRSPRAAAAQILPQAAAPPVPRQVEPPPQAVQPQAAPPPQAEPHLSSALRPPMPVP
jgi:hypothetical protein